MEHLGQLNPVWSMCVAIAFRRGLGELSGAIADAFRDLEWEDEQLASEILAEISATDMHYRQACDATRVVAEYLRCHPRVRLCNYPGLSGDPSHDAARRLFHHGFGNLVDIQLVADASLLRTTLEKPLHEQGFSCRVVGDDVLRLSFEASCSPREAVCTLETLLRD